MSNFSRISGWTISLIPAYHQPPLPLNPWSHFKESKVPWGVSYIVFAKIWFPTEWWPLKNHHELRKKQAFYESCPPHHPIVFSIVLLISKVDSVEMKLRRRIEKVVSDVIRMAIRIKFWKVLSSKDNISEEVTIKIQLFCFNQAKQVVMKRCKLKPILQVVWWEDYRASPEDDDDD